jgi:hypothetical protein
MAVRARDLVAKLTVNVSMHKVVDYETLKRSVIGYIVHSSYSLRALCCDIFLARIRKYDHGS